MPANRLVALLLLSLATAACGSDEAPPSKPCDQACKDATAVRSLRETLKLVYNLTLQGNPVGAQDETTDCPLGGSARVVGVASADPTQGATFVSLVYVLEACAYNEVDEEPGENYEMTFSGVLVQEGTLAVQPSATTALIMQSEAMSLSGSVYDPPLEFSESDCSLRLGQSGNQIAGKLCGRTAGAEL